MPIPNTQKSNRNTAKPDLKITRLYFLSQNKKLLMYITNYENLVNKHYLELIKIKSTKFFKIWQLYCQFRDHFLK